MVMRWSIACLLVCVACGGTSNRAVGDGNGDLCQTGPRYGTTCYGGVGSPGGPPPIQRKPTDSPPVTYGHHKDAECAPPNTLKNGLCLPPSD